MEYVFWDMILFVLNNNTITLQLIFSNQMFIVILNFK